MASRSKLRRDFVRVGAISPCHMRAFGSKAPKADAAQSLNNPGTLLRLQTVRQSTEDARMKAAVIYEHGGPGAIRYEKSFPDPRPGAGDVIVRVRATSLNYHDIFTRRGMPGIKVPMPAIMGLDFAGEIVALGANVRDWRVGERVMIDPVDRVGPGGLVGEVRPGGLAEFCAVPTHHLVRMPEGVDGGFAVAAHDAVERVQEMFLDGLAGGVADELLGDRANPRRHIDQLAVFLVAFTFFF